MVAVARDVVDDLAAAFVHGPVAGERPRARAGGRGQRDEQCGGRDESGQAVSSLLKFHRLTARRALAERSGFFWTGWRTFPRVLESPPHVRDRRLHRGPPRSRRSSSRASRSSSTAAMTPRASRCCATAASTRCAPSATSARCDTRSPTVSRPPSAGGSVAVASAPRRPASATPAGQPTAASPRPTPTRTPTRTTASTSSSTGSSRTTWSSRTSCVADGAVFTSETDAEVIAHLISRHSRRATASSRPCSRAYNRLRGHYAFVAVSADEPELLVGARKECPLVVGRGEDEQFIASAIPAFLAHTRHVQLIENDEIVVVRRDGVEFLTAAGEPIERAIDEVDWSQEVAEKGGYETFMLKEIHEQADAVAETIADRTVRPDGVDLDGLGTIDDAFLRGCNRIVIVACGTSYHAGLIGRYALGAVGARPGRDGHRLGVPLPRSGGRPGRPRHRHHAVGRDRRHARRHAAGQGARRQGHGRHEHHGLAGHARRPRRALHARRPRGRRGRDQDLRRPGRRHVPARAAARRAARHASARAPVRARRRAQAHPALHRRDARGQPDGRDRPHRRASPPRRVLPLPRPPRRPAGVPRGRAQAQGDLLHRHRRLRGRRDEARPDRAARARRPRSSSWRPTRPCSRRSSRTCRRCAPAART